ncbi:MAG: c-type cytochrome [Pseudomonadales bacterium]
MTLAAFLVAPVAQAAGNPEAGKAQSVACAACHGADGASPIAPSYAWLAGQNEKYLLRQLKMVQSNERQIALMAGQLTGKSEQDLADLAAYYASLPDKVVPTEASDETLELAAGIYRGGILEKGVAACTSCHAPSGNGNALAGFPAIGGQPPEYTIAQLTAYREGQRATDEDFGGMMRGVAARLTDTEIKALAEYLRGLH